MSKLTNTIKKSVLSFIDPDRVDSEFSVDDLKKPPPTITDEEADIVELVMDRYKGSSEQRRIHERDWLLCQAFRSGNQWMEYDRNGTLADMSAQVNGDTDAVYIVDDQIDNIVRKFKARATMSKPDASVKPLTLYDKDVLAAGEARDILAHYDSKFNRQEQSIQWVDSMASTSTTFLKIIWDNSAEILAPTTHGGADRQRIGDIDEIIVPPFEVFPDPAAREWEEVTWLIHAKERPLSYVQQHYGEYGLRVRGSKMRGDSVGYSLAEQRLDQISGDGSSTGQSNEQTLVVYECWEKPSLLYPVGRRMTVAGGRVMSALDVTTKDNYDDSTYKIRDKRRSLDWPYTRKHDDFPFVPLQSEKKSRGLWSTSIVWRLIPLQREINKTLSRMSSRIGTDKPAILDPAGSEIGIEELNAPERDFIRLKYQPGFEPKYLIPPGAPGYWFQYLELLQAHMQDISGVHDVSNGTAPGNVSAGYAIELLQQSDQTQISEVVMCMETAQKKRAEWEIALVAQYYTEPRLVAVSTLDRLQVGTQEPSNKFEASSSQSPTAGTGETPNASPSEPTPSRLGSLPLSKRKGLGQAQLLQPMPLGVEPPATPTMAVRAFEGLTQGGQVRIEVVPGSATPKTPASRAQTWLDMSKAGMLQPANLATTAVLITQMGLDRSDELVDQLSRLAAEYQAQQPDPVAAQMVQQQNQAEQAAAQQAHLQAMARMQLQHEAQMAAIQSHATIEVDAAKTDNAIRLEQAKVQLQTQSQIAVSQVDHKEALQSQTNEHHHAAAMVHAESVAPKVSFAVPVDPTAAVALEKKYLGVEGKEPKPVRLGSPPLTKREGQEGSPS